MTLNEDDVNAEVMARAKAQNEQYLELMTRVGPDEAYALLGSPPSVENPAAALETLRPKLDRFVALCRTYLDAQDQAMARRIGTTPPLCGAQGPMTVRYIFTASRLAPDSSFFARIAAGMALMQADKRVVGVNILTPEDHPFARTHFETQMRLIDFLWKQFGHPNLTLHAGELTLAISPLEPMQSRIRRTIEVGHARRIGHGVSIAWEDDLPGLFREMKRDGVAVEICLTSNAGILGVSGDQHPFNLYRKSGIPVSLNTDDEGINRSNLTMEFVRAVQTYHLSYAEVKELARNSIEYSFLPGDSLFIGHDYHWLRPDFTGVQRPGWKPSPETQRTFESSETRRVQVRLEQAFAAFEN
ncbi:MAG: adenosine deaminase [Chthonomonadaceae bacterium]|nr:adenosine deaminase [Chthonomonadaceae bacterium]